MKMHFKIIFSKLQVLKSSKKWLSFLCLRSLSVFFWLNMENNINEGRSKGVSHFFWSGYWFSCSYIFSWIQFAFQIWRQRSIGQHKMAIFSDSTVHLRPSNRAFYSRTKQNFMIERLRVYRINVPMSVFYGVWLNCASGLHRRPAVTCTKISCIGLCDWTCVYHSGNARDSKVYAV